MTDEKQLTMDRVYERLTDVNDRLIVAIRKLEKLTREIEQIRVDLANIITPASPEGWRILAENDGMIVPGEDNEKLSAD